MSGRSAARRRCRGTDRHAQAGSPLRRDSRWPGMPGRKCLAARSFAIRKFEVGGAALQIVLDGGDELQCLGPGAIGVVRGDAVEDGAVIGEAGMAEIAHAERMLPEAMEELVHRTDDLLEQRVTGSAVDRLMELPVFFRGHA